MNNGHAGWERLVDLSVGQRIRLAAVVVAPAALVVFPAAQLITVFLADEASVWTRILVQLGVAFIILLLTVAIRARFQDAPLVNFALQKLRVGRRQFGFVEVNVAGMQGMPASQKDNGFVLRFGIDHGPQARVLLQSGPRGLSGASRERLLAVLRESRIAMPADAYDPKGKFAHFNHPANLTKDQVIELVENHLATDESRPGG